MYAIQSQLLITDEEYKLLQIYIRWYFSFLEYSLQFVPILSDWINFSQNQRNIQYPISKLSKCLSGKNDK